MSVDDDFSNDSSLHQAYSALDHDCLASLVGSNAAMVAALRVNSSVPYSIIPSIVDFVNGIIVTTVHFVQSETHNCYVIQVIVCLQMLSC